MYKKMSEIENNYVLSKSERFYIDEKDIYILTPLRNMIRNIRTGTSMEMVRERGRLFTAENIYIESGYPEEFIKFNMKQFPFYWANDCVVGKLNENSSGGEYIISENHFEEGQKLRLKTIKELLKDNLISIDDYNINNSDITYSIGVYRKIENKIGIVQDVHEIFNKNMIVLEFLNKDRVILPDYFFKKTEDTKMEEVIEKDIVENIEEIKKEMIEKVDIEKMKKILSASFRIKKSDLKGIDAILNKWAENKYKIYLMFEKNLVLEKDIEYERSLSEQHQEIFELMRKYPYLYAIYRTDSNNLIGNNYISSSSCFEEITNRRGGKITTLIKAIEKNMKPIENLKQLTEEEKEIYLQLREKVTYTSPILDDYTKFLAHNKIKGKIKISINPIDYILMSFNKSGWSSCYNISKKGRQRCFGEYVNGLFSYMQDNNSIIAYKHSNTEFEFEIGKTKFKDYSKSWRQVIYLDAKNGSFVTSRQYPENNEEISKDVRNILEEKVSKYFEKENKWKVGYVKNNLPIIQNCFCSNGEEMGYNDILRDNCISKARYVRLKEYNGFPQFEIITSTICPICGENEVFENEVPFCEKCVKNIGFYDEFDEDDDEDDDE